MIMIQVEVDVPAYATFKDTITATIKVTRSLHSLNIHSVKIFIDCSLPMSSSGQLRAGQTCQGNRDNCSVSQIQVRIPAANFPGAPPAGTE